MSRLPARNGRFPLSAWVLSYTLAVAAVTTATIAIAIVVSAFTVQNERTVQMPLFGAVPILSLLAAAAAAGFPRTTRGATALLVLGIAVAAWAHLDGYAALDAASPGAMNGRWMALVALAIAVIGAGAGAMIWRGVRASMSRSATALVSLFGGLATGAAAVPALALPLTAPTVALAAAAIVWLLHRRDRARAHRIPSQTSGRI